MLIDFVSPIHPIDACSQRAFVEILNLVLLSDHVAELERRLAARDRDTQYRSLSGYYRWSFEDYSFTLWQRIEFGGERCFKTKILEIKHVTLICRDRERFDAVKN